jgi:hypothetical protein
MGRGIARAVPVKVGRKRAWAAQRDAESVSGITNLLLTSSSPRAATS